MKPFPSDFANDLPAPRDDEPASLRRDIADELADHLNSSFNRELHTTRDETTATRNALDRFGDPEKIARKLWLDAMQEKIMSQRFGLVLGTLMTSVCLAVLVVVILMFRESQAFSAALIAKLESISAQPPQILPPSTAMTDSHEWQRLRFKLVIGQEDGPPATGLKVSLGGKLLGGEERVDTERTTGEDGLVDFGLVHVGQHSWHVTTPWGEACNETILVNPGFRELTTVVCPAAAPAECDVDFAVD